MALGAIPMVADFLVIWYSGYGRVDPGLLATLGWAATVGLFILVIGIFTWLIGVVVQGPSKVDVTATDAGSGSEVIDTARR